MSSKTYKISKVVQLPMFSGIDPVRLFPLTSLANNQEDEERTLKIRTDWKNTYKYHNPVSWHISGDNVPVKEFPRRPLDRKP